MKHLFTKSLAILLIALLLVPAALAEDIIAPVEAVDEAVPEADSIEMDSIDLDEDAELPVEAGFVSDESYQADLSSFEAADGIPIDEAHFPDPAVRNKLLSGSYYRDSVNVAYDTDHDGRLNADEIASITTFFPDNGATDLRGLELLTAVEEISLFNYKGTTADLTGLTQLKGLQIGDSDTVTTVICPASLESIQIFPTPALSTLDISRCTNLRFLEFWSEKLASVDVSKNPNLEHLAIGGKGLKTVKLGNQPKLKELECCDNAVKSLDISGCPLLIPAVNDKYKKSWKAGQGEPYARVDYNYGDASISVSPTIKLVTEKKSETVTPAEDNSITTTAVSTKASVDVGQSYTLSASGQKASGFKSSNAKVVSVTKSGKLVPKKAGKAKITYKVNGKTRTVTLTIKDPTVPTSIKLDQSGTVATKVGDKITLNATLNEGAVSGIKWTTSNKKIATVKNGVVTFKKAGKVTITATTKRGNKKAKVKFNVSK